MNAEQLRLWIRQSPFRPCELRLADGRGFPVTDSACVGLFGNRIVITSSEGDELIEVPIDEVRDLLPIATSVDDVPVGELRNARDVFRQWEWLRLSYNGILIIWTAIWIVACQTSFGPDRNTGGGQVTDWHLLAGRVLIGAVIANVAFFAGPLVVVYVNWLGYRPSWLTMLLFILGTFLTMLLAMGVILDLAFAI